MASEVEWVRAGSAIDQRFLKLRYDREVTLHGCRSFSVTNDAEILLILLSSRLPAFSSPRDAFPSLGQDEVYGLSCLTAGGSWEVARGPETPRALKRAASIAEKINELGTSACRQTRPEAAPRSVRAESCWPGALSGSVRSPS